MTSRLATGKSLTFFSVYQHYTSSSIICRHVVSSQVLLQIPRGIELRLALVLTWSDPAHILLTGPTCHNPPSPLPLPPTLCFLITFFLLSNPALSLYIFPLFYYQSSILTNMFQIFLSPPPMPFEPLISTHCNENPIYVFLSGNFPIHVSVSDLYIPRIGPDISCSRIRRSIIAHKHLTMGI